MRQPHLQSQHRPRLTAAACSANGPIARNSAATISRPRRSRSANAQPLISNGCSCSRRLCSREWRSRRFASGRSEAENVARLPLTAQISLSQKLLRTTSVPASSNLKTQLYGPHPLSAHALFEARITNRRRRLHGRDRSSSRTKIRRTRQSRTKRPAEWFSIDRLRY